MQYKLFKQRTNYKDNPEAENALMKKYNLSPLAAKLLVKRGIASLGDAGMFLCPDEEHLFSPFLFSDMRKAVERIWQACENKERITIYGDYDCVSVAQAGKLFHAGNISLRQPCSRLDRIHAERRLSP